jgi:hypothetical protein
MKFSQLPSVILMMTISTAISGMLFYSNKSGADHSGGLQNAVVLIIRHAEKPDNGDGLSPAGEERAKAYVNYFQNFTVDSNPVRLNYLFSAADSKESRRPRLTIEPLSKTLGLAIDSRFKNKQFPDLAHEIQNLPQGKNILICWHHGEIPQLVRALGADPEKLIPNAKWPGDVFGWLIQLRYDAKGHLFESKRINEYLLSDDTSNHALAKP